jgi:hypothetical protein
MATYSKQLLSASTNGKAVNVTATGSSTTLIHTTAISAALTDEVWLYATNATTSDITLTLLYGGTDFTNDVLFDGVIEAYSGSVLVCSGLVARGNGTTGFSIYGNSSVATGLNVFGYVNRIS